VANFSINWFMAFLSVPMCFREQHHTDSGTPFIWLRLCRAVLNPFGGAQKAGLVACLVVNKSCL